MVLEKQISFGEHKLTIKTGHIANQADGAVIVDLDDTVVLVTVVGDKTSKGSRDFLPLTVNYQEKSYAAGKIPGGYFKREGRPTETETLTSRLMDRPLRPLFPKGYFRDIQIIATVISLNPEVIPDIPALIGASAALSISGIPFDGPIGAIRVGYKDGVYISNPTRSQLLESELDLVVAGTKESVLMVESEAKELSESIMLGAVLYGHEMMQSVIDVIKEMVDELGVKQWDFEEPSVDLVLESNVKQAFEEDIKSAYAETDKLNRKNKLNELKENAIAKFVNEDEDNEKDVLQILAQLEKQFVRKNILNGEARIDGRDTKTVRDITIENGFLPRAHGSCLFSRGETQALVVTTLGNERDVQIIDAIEGERKDRFMLHYNFPPYSVGEVSMQFGPKRREIGHGKLARRALSAVLPEGNTYPYITRIVSEITSSNGSSSMATVCGASLALMDAGVPIKAHVSGVAMGLIKEKDRFAVLTDILGDEDHLGDMDFKVAGTEKGITALQMDIKIKGITNEIMEKALDQAKDGRMVILKQMNDSLAAPRSEMSKYAPRIKTIKVPTDKIRDVIGKGGATIRQLTEESGANIDIDDTGKINIFAVNDEVAKDIEEKIKRLTSDVAIGEIYDGTVMRIVDFGAFVSILPNKDGLLHISQISEKRIDKVTDVLSEGQKVKVKVLDVDKMGRVKLTMKEFEESTAVSD